MSSLPPAVSAFDSKIESVDVAEEVTRQYAQSIGFEEPDQYYMGLALREIFVNAIKHGNKFDLNKKVMLQLSNPDGAIVIEVIDEGHGFRVNEVPNPRAPENLGRSSGRGIMIALGLMDEFHVETDKPEGTHVRMTKRLAKP